MNALTVFSVFHHILSSATVKMVSSEGIGSEVLGVGLIFLVQLLDSHLIDKLLHFKMKLKFKTLLIIQMVDTYLPYGGTGLSFLTLFISVILKKAFFRPKK